MSKLLALYLGKSCLITERSNGSDLVRAACDRKRAAEGLSPDKAPLRLQGERARPGRKRTRPRVRNSDFPAVVLLLVLRPLLETIRAIGEIRVALFSPPIRSERRLKLHGPPSEICVPP